MATTMKVTLEPDHLALAPGDSADVTVTIQNASQVVEHFAASVVGLPRQDLITCEPAVVKLRPRETGTVRVRISLPERDCPVAGRYTLGVLVRSPYQREVSRCEELVLDIQPVPALAMLLQPEVVTGGSSGHFGVSLRNEGNTPLAVALGGADPENRVGFEFETGELRLAPGMVGNTRLVVRSDPPLTGQELRRAMTVRAHAGELVVERPATFVQRPRIAGGLLKISGLAAGVALLAGATVGGALLIRGAKQQAANVAQTAAHGQLQTTAHTPTTAAPTSAAASATAATTTTQTGAGGTTASSAPPPPAPPGGSKLVDFTRLPNGQPDGDQIVPPDEYSASGIKLSTVTQNAPPDCQDATALAVRTAGTFGSFLTSARPAGVDLCNTIPVRVDFAAPARLVHLNAIGDGNGYTMTIQLTDGSTDSRTVTGAAGAVTPIDYEAPAGNSIASITYGHASQDPTSKDPTVLKSLAYTPA